MEYPTNCLACSKPSTRGQKNEKCNNCKAAVLLNKYLNDEQFLTKKTHNKEKIGIITIKLIKFLRESQLMFQTQYRIVVDFLKVMELYSENNGGLSECDIQNKYYEVSAIKSSGALNIIKVFLNSQGLIKFDIEGQTFFPSLQIEPRNRYNDDILNYFFSDTKCHDCGTVLKSRSNSFCLNCMAYRGIYNQTTFEYLEKTFKNNSIKSLYYNYCLYLAGLNRTAQTTLGVLKYSKRYFIFLSDYIPETLNFWPFIYPPKHDCEREIKVLKNKSLVKFTFSEELIEILKEEFKDNYKGMSLFLNFLNKCEVISFEEKNPKEKIEEKIKEIRNNFQKLLFSYLEKNAAEIEILNKKNAVKNKKWSTVYNNIISIINFYNWITINKSIENWTEVTDGIVNQYLLEFPGKSRDLRRRILFNFFEFARKKRFIFSNPIEQFIAKDRMIEIKPLTLKEHAEIYLKLTSEHTHAYQEKFLASLIYFHAVTPRDLREITLENIFLDKKSILLASKRIIYLTDNELLLLHLFLEDREFLLKGNLSKYLFCSYKSLSDTSIKNITILKKVKSLLGMTPKSLRIAALQYCAASFGAEYLHNCFGLSLTQAERYANIGEWLLDETIDEDINNN